MGQAGSLTSVPRFDLAIQPNRAWIIVVALRLPLARLSDGAAAAPGPAAGR